MFPRAAVQPKELEMVIATLEKDVQIYETASSETIPASQRRLNLLEMCPEQLKKHVRPVLVEFSRDPICADTLTRHEGSHARYQRLVVY